MDAVNKNKASWQVAAIIAYMMKKNGLSRARISDKTLRGISGRARLEATFREQIRLDALEYGYLIHRLDGVAGVSGNVVLAISALESAKLIKKSGTFSDEEWRAIEDGTTDIDRLNDDFRGETDDD